MNSQMVSSQVPFGCGASLRSFSQNNVIGRVQLWGVMVWRVPANSMWMPGLGRESFGLQMIVPDASSRVKCGKG